MPDTTAFYTRRVTDRNTMEEGGRYGRDIVFLEVQEGSPKILVRDGPA